MTERLGFQLVKNHGLFEVRDYPKHVLVSTLEFGDLSAAGNQAFRRLANYIFGGNRANQTIAMTAPVFQAKTKDGYRISFVMPKGMEFHNLPATSDSSLAFEEVDALRYAAISFSGMASEGLFAAKAAALEAALQSNGFEVAGPAIYARYDGPWKPFFLRHNEVLIPLLR